MPTSVELLDATDRLSPDSVLWIAQHIEKAMQHLGCSGEVRVRVIEDAEMAQAHEEFAGQPGTTDVLTFDMTDHEETGESPGIDLGTARLTAPFGVDTDILVCIDEAFRQIQPVGTGSGGRLALERELLLYALHGILHCLGMDDHEPAAFEAMHAVEDRVLKAIGVGPVFRTPPQAGSGA